MCVLFKLSLLLLLALQCSSHKIDPSLHRERESDGAFSGRGEQHSVDGEHNSDFDHESILGSAKDAEEFDNLPPTEAKKRLAVLVKRMDVNGDKKINSKELHQWILNSFDMLSKEESAERLEEADENEDGLVSWSEHLKETYGIDDPESIDLITEDKETTATMEEDKDLFDAADIDRDGKLNEKEYLSFTHPEEDETMIPVILNHFLKEKDTNKDGLIDFQEFIKGQMTEQPTDEFLLTEKERFDEDYDKNSDGVLDRLELRHWLVPDNQETAEAEVKHLFASADEDVDGMLSEEEILMNHDVFVGSEATDYGEHLNNMERFADEL